MKRATAILLWFLSLWGVAFTVLADPHKVSPAIMDSGTLTITFRTGWKNWCENNYKKCHEEWCERHPEVCNEQTCANHPEKCHRQWCENHPGVCSREWCEDHPRECRR